MIPADSQMQVHISRHRNFAIWSIGTRDMPVLVKNSKILSYISSKVQNPKTPKPQRKHKQQITLVWFINYYKNAEQLTHEKSLGCHGQSTVQFSALSLRNASCRNLRVVHRRIQRRPLPDIQFRDLAIAILTTRHLRQYLYDAHRLSLSCLR